MPDPAAPAPQHDDEPPVDPQAASSALPNADPPPAGAQVAGAESPPAGVVAAAPEAVAPMSSSPISSAQPSTTLVETPTQGAAVIAGSPIPAVDAEPIQPLSVDAPLPTAEHPMDTLARIREKLSAYGEEVLEKVRPEIEYLMSLCDPEDHA
jgi:hypothetical protein